MFRVLIGHSSAVFARCVAQKLGDDFETQICLDGRQMGHLLDSYQPDVLILHSAMPHKDSLTILSERPVLPQLTLVTTNYLSSQMEWKLSCLGVQRVMLMPSPSEVAAMLDSFLPLIRESNCDGDTYRVRLHLMALNFDTHLDGFRLICTAVALLRKDLSQTLSKHIYPVVAKIHNMTDQRAVEHSIRNSIDKAWRHRDERVWMRFFPPDNAGKIKCPTNRKMLTSLAQWITIKD